MFIITNRELKKQAESYDVFTKYPNKKGPNELSAASITGVINPTVTVLDDRLSKAEVKQYIEEFNLALDESQPYYASLKVACDTFRQARKECKSVLLYVHGYNNDIKDVYSQAREIEKLYNVIVIIFTWPANGGGALSGTLSYLSDKRDARASNDALNRTVDLIARYHDLLTNSTRKSFEIKASEKYPHNQTKQREYLARLLVQNCDLTVNMMCHSMGNYVLKHALKSSLSEARKLVFDNIILVAADANNEEHEKWVEMLQVRKSVFITINENDYALSWSRIKPGEQQKARLGHYLKNLIAKNALYIDFTREKSVNKSHSYFDNKTANHNKGVQRFFMKVFSGQTVNSNLDYIQHNNTYRPK